jgi:DNA-binding transcriptional regulator LsrR (DeoR family)
MPTGTKITAEVQDRILELASQTYGDNEFANQPRQIAQRLGISERTVSRVIRLGAKRYVRITSSHPELKQD